MAEINISLDNFEKEVIKSEIPVILDFYATWCGPCMMIAPVLEEIARENEGKIKVCKVNVDENIPLAQKYGVESIPTVFVFKNGEITNKALGYMNKDKILSLL